MLAHLQHFYFPPLLIYLNRLHILFLYNFNGHLFICNFVNSHLNESELALAQSLVQIVEIKEVGVTDSLFNQEDPVGFVLLT